MVFPYFRRFHPAHRLKPNSISGDYLLRMKKLWVIKLHLVTKLSP